MAQTHWARVNSAQKRGAELIDDGGHDSALPASGGWPASHRARDPSSATSNRRHRSAKGRRLTSPSRRQPRRREREPDRGAISQLGLTESAWILAVAFSRVYTGVHDPGDVVIGAAVGAVIGHRRRTRGAENHAQPDPHCRTRSRGPPRRGLYAVFGTCPRSR